MLRDHKVKKTKNGVIITERCKPKYPRREERVIFSDERLFGGEQLIKIREYMRRGEADVDELHTIYLTADAMDVICESYQKWRRDHRGGKK